MAASVGIALHGAAGVVVAVLGIAILALDGLDGWLARRGNLTSEFGAHFDMETDALFVLIMTFELWHRHQLGGWILISGLLRYAYVLCLALVPPRGADMPRSRFGRHAFTLLVSGLCAAFALPNALGAAAAFAGTAAVSASFMRSFYWSYRGGARPLRLS
jgi:phosphatidylglycerophosphate synthase